MEKKWCVTPAASLKEGYEVQIKLGKSPGAKVWSAIYLGLGVLTECKVHMTITYKTSLAKATTSYNFPVSGHIIIC